MEQYLDRAPLKTPILGTSKNRPDARRPANEPPERTGGVREEGEFAGNNADGRLLEVPDKKIGVAIVGMGVGEQHALAYKNDKRCHLRKIFDIDRNRALSGASTLGVESIVDKYEDILSDRAVDVVSIASYDDAHYGQVIAALTAGKHVFVEKPLCRKIDELETVKELWNKYEGKLKLRSNLILRSVPLYQWLKQKILEGEFGEIYAFDGEYLYGRLYKITNGWRKDVENYSVMEGGGIHLIDLMLWLVGQKPESVFSVGNRICTRNTEFRYNDFVASTFEFPSGLVGRITANFGCVHSHQHVLRVFGTKATFIYDDEGPRFHATREPNIKAKHIEFQTLPSHKGDLIPQFISAIIENRNINADTQDVFDGISMCAAADEALKTSSKKEIIYI